MNTEYYKIAQRRLGMDIFEKVNPSHPDKIADRIAGALVDLAYTKDDNPKVAVEVLIGHGKCSIINETSVHLEDDEVKNIVNRIAGDVEVEYGEFKQDVHLSDNQNGTIKCGDNGVFKGVPVSLAEKKLTKIADEIYKEFPYDGKYVINNDKLIICQSNLNKELPYKNAVVNPLGYWTGGIDVDSGATNRKLGSDMGASITGGGLHGKDLSKADVSVNIYAFLEAQRLNKVVEFSCAIGDEKVDGKPYEEIVKKARNYINKLGGFEKLAEWGLIRNE